MRVLACVLLVLTAAAPAAAEPEQAFDPGAQRRTLALPTTKVMIFGLSHLDGAPDTFQTAWLEPILCRLRKYKPDIILTEAMPGQEIMALDANAAYHGDAGKYGGPTLSWAKAAQARLGLSAAAALVQANALATTGPTTDAERRRLAALFVAAAEPYSAVVQWMRLSAGARREGEGVDAKLAASLTKLAGGRSELASVAARVAADIGLQRLHSAGSHMSDVVMGDWTAFAAAADATPGQKALFNHDTSEFRAVPEEAMTLASADQVMPAMKWRNSERWSRLDADAQWGSVLRAKTMGKIGRQIVAGWEAQNLRMTVAIRDATAPMPGSRALLVVGAAHKPYIEAYLRNLSDVEIVSSAAMLDAKPAGCRS